MKLFTPSTPDDNASGKSLIRRIFPDLLAFAFGLGLAYFMKWETTDLVWSLWLCSLVLGYLTLLSALGGGAVVWLRAISHPQFARKKRTSAIFFGLATGLFILGFFSLHFGAFHAGHSVFLQEFFPIDGLPDDGFGDAFMNPPLLWIGVFQHLIAPYGLFLIPAIVAERQHVFKPLIRAVKAVRTGAVPDIPLKAGAEEQKARKSDPVGEAMARPYVNVVRMHLLIFFFGISHALKLDSFLVYATVYAVYFFPWSEFRKVTASGKQADASA